MTTPKALRPVRPKDCRAIPLAGQQGELDIQAVGFDGEATPGDCPTDPVPHGVEVQVELFGGRV
jgi:hypothetical protein